MSIPLIQKILVEERLDGWLLYDFRGLNPIFGKIVGASHTTRRTFYWIPRTGEPWKIVHKIETHTLDGVEGVSKVYAQREELEKVLAPITGKVAMEYSPDIPAISFVDGGTIDVLRKGRTIVSSGVLVQKLLSVLDGKGIASHLAAADVLDRVVMEAFTFVQKQLPYEKEVEEFILRQFQEEECTTDHGPIVARGKNSGNPHYVAKGKGDKFAKGDFVLIDLWCKKKEKGSVYADITRVGCLGKPSEKMQRAFHAVREAQKAAVQGVKPGVRGCDIDTLARGVLEKHGYGANVLHRLGHSIDTDLHGSGANLDSFETFDTRVLLPNTCYSNEPALYFPGEFGLRLEHDMLLTQVGVQVTGGTQEEIYPL